MQKRRLRPKHAKQRRAQLAKIVCMSWHNNNNNGYNENNNNNRLGKYLKKPIGSGSLAILVREKAIRARLMVAPFKAKLGCGRNGEEAWHTI